MDLFIDTETTGFGENDEILQIAICDIDGNEIWNEKYLPEAKTEWDTSIHGITPDSVSRKLSEDVERIREILEGNKVWAYNAPFDGRFLRKSGIKSNVNDLMTPAKRRFRHICRDLSLEGVSKAIGYTYQAHDALNDARAAANLKSYLGL